MDIEKIKGIFFLKSNKAFTVFRVGPYIPGKHAFFMVWYQPRRISIFLWKFKLSLEKRK